MKEVNSCDIHVKDRRCSNYAQITSSTPLSTLPSCDAQWPQIFKKEKKNLTITLAFHLEFFGGQSSPFFEKCP